jgi:high affinity sulfate transporter 1
VRWSSLDDAQVVRDDTAVDADGPVASRPMRAGRLRRWLPGFELIGSYRRAWLRDDLLAGIVVTALLIPAGIGYAQAAGLPPVTGLYASIVPLVAYALFGPSRIFVLGPDSSLAPIIASAVLPLAAGDEGRAVALAGLLAILMGLVLAAAGLLRLGFVTDLLSKPVRVGYLNGIACIVIVGQLPKLLGFSVGADSIPATLRETVRGVRDGLVDVRAFAIGAAVLAVVTTLRALGSRVPGVAVGVVGAAVVTALTGWHDRVPVVGAMPRGLPHPTLGGLGWRDVVELLPSAFGIALIAFADSGVLSRAFAARRGETVVGNDEMRGIGLANIASGALGGFPVAASATRTPVAEQAGARTQLTGVVGAALIVVFVVAAPGATSYLPSAALAGVIIVAATSLVDLNTMWWLARVARVDAVLSLAAVVGVVFIGVLEGIAIAVLLSLATFVIQAWRPYRAELGLVPGLRGYHDLARHPTGGRIPGVLILRFDAPLFFANGGLFDTFVRGRVDDTTAPLHTVVLAAEPITDVDSTAVDELVELDDFLRSRNITLLFAEMKDPVRDQLSRYGLDERFGPERFKPTVGAAVDEITGRLRTDITGV